LHQEDVIKEEVESAEEFSEDFDNLDDYVSLTEED